MNKGIFIAIDGIDGAGKTTQSELLFDTLKQFELLVIRTKEPTDKKWGKKLRKSANSGRLPIEKEIEYFIKDRLQHLEEVIKPALASGNIVITDRFYYSSIAYQGVRCKDFDKTRKTFENNAIKPDITFIMDADVEVCLHRIEKLRGDTLNHFEKAEYQKQVRKIFLRLCNIENEIVKINAQNEIKIIHKQIMKNLAKLLKDKMCKKEYKSDCYWCNYRRTKDCNWIKMVSRFKKKGLDISY